MSRIAIGIDLGTNGLKVAEVEGSWRGCTLRRIYCRELERSLLTSAQSEQLTNALKEWSQEWGSFRHPMVSSLPPTSVIAPALTLPFKGSRKVRQVIKYEVESLVPLRAEDFTASFTMAGEAEEGGVEVVALVAPKAALERHLQIFASAGLSPTIVGFGPLAALNFCLATDPAFGERPTVLIDLGAGTTSVVVVEGGKFLFARSIPMGGDLTTLKIADAQKVTFAEAEARKKVAPLREGDPVGRIAKAALGEVLQEVELTLHSYVYGQKNRPRPEQVFLIGGGAAAEGITEAVSETLSLPCQRFEPRHGEALLEIGEEGRGDSCLMATAAGLGLRATGPRKDEVDFRQEEYALIDDPRKSRRRWAAAGVGLVLLLALLLVNLFIKAQLNQRELAALEAEIKRNLITTIPDVKRVVNPLSQARTRMGEMEARVRVFEGTSVAGLSPLNILRELSFRLPSSLSVQLLEVSIDDEGISLSGTTNSFDSVNRLQRHLQESPFFREVKISSARAAVGGRGISFRMFLASTPLEKG